jgi:2-amino-4-hydroxy-6-hydroxymethyldihydropteridine diphosphokinase
VYVALGSNLGDRRGNLTAAIERLGRLSDTAVISRASVLESEALLPAPDAPAQPPYLNTVVALTTALAPAALLAELQRIERALGRTAAPRWAARVIDLDVVLWGERVFRWPGFEVPHPELHRRHFVLAPLAQLAPQALHPVLRKTVSALLACLDQRGALARGVDGEGGGPW